MMANVTINSGISCSPVFAHACRDIVENLVFTHVHELFFWGFSSNTIETDKLLPVQSTLYVMSDHTS